MGTSVYVGWWAHEKIMENREKCEMAMLKRRCKRKHFMERYKTTNTGKKNKEKRSVWNKQNAVQSVFTPFCIALDEED